MSTAAILLIGNELLSGKIRDENASWLAGRLRALGVELRRICVVPDEPEAIIDELLRVHPTVDHLFTSGGVGPTHDDITLETVAAAFGVPLVREPRLEALIRGYFEDRLRPEHLRMADVPAGSELLWGDPSRWPVYSFRGIYILPGVPSIFRAKFEVIAERFTSPVFHLRDLYLDADEGSIAALLWQTQERHGVQIGSYPNFEATDHRVRITVESRDVAAVEAAVSMLLAELPPKAVRRVEGGPKLSDRS